MATPGSRKSEKMSSIAQAYRAANEIVSAGIALALLVGAGYWADNEFGWSPVLTICGACLGFAMASLSLWQLLRRLDQESEKKKRRAAEK